MEAFAHFNAKPNTQESIKKNKDYQSLSTEPQSSTE